MMSNKIAPAHILIVLLLSISHVVADEVKVATVNIDKLLLHYRAADKELSYLKSGRDRYLRDRNTRQKKINSLALDIKEVYAKLKNKAMPRSERDHLIDQRQNLIVQYKALANEIKLADGAQAASTKQKITAATRRILDQCKLTTNKYAKSHGYQWVIESSGTTSSQVSPLIYARHAIDITDEILALLNDVKSQ
ncbi:MAG: hypothetical protein GWP68_06810 [Verrucomicrobiaceae bacterium]|nr:hypothetical protein [Verrucomicrobiaceae bacterium]